MATKKVSAKKSSKVAKKSLAKKESQAMQESQVMQSPLAGLTEKQRRSLTLGILVVLIISALAYYYKGQFISATVNGKPILRSTVVKQLEKQGGKQTLDSLITEQLILQEAQKRNITMSDAEVLSQIEDTLKAQGQSLDAVLKAQNLTKEFIISAAKPQFILQKMLKEKISVSDKEIADFLEKNKEALPKDAKESDLKKQAKAQIENQKLSSEAQKLIADLKAKAKINNYAQY